MEEKVLDAEKIIVKGEDELIDITKKVKSSESEKVILTFTESSDLLVSPINLKTIQDTADLEGKVLVFQIVQNPVGIRNATQAGVFYVESPGVITEPEWEEAEKRTKDRLQKRKEMLKATNSKIVEKKEEPKPQITEEPPVATMSEKVDPQQESEFQKRIASALERSKQEMETGRQKIVEEGGVELALGQDIAEMANAPTPRDMQKSPSLVGKSMPVANQATEVAETPETVKPQKKKGGFKLPVAFAKIGGKIALIPAKIAKFIGKKGAQAVLLRIGVPILALLLISGWIVVRFLPLAKVNIYIESKPVSLEKTFKGSPSVTTFDLENLRVPVKKEVVTKKRADNTEPTGTAYKGEKAEGIAQFKYWSFVEDGAQPITIPVGTVITSGSLSFETTTAFTLGDGGTIFKSAAVRALEVGEEYNLPSGTAFTVAGYPETSLTAESEGAFSGGSKEPYTVLSQKDVDDVVDDLKKSAYEDAKSELESLATGEWELIASTIKNELDDNISTDVPVGAEADTVNISIKTDSTALYYDKESLVGIVEDQLRQAAIDQDLFESSTATELQLDTHIEQEITVEDVTKETVTIKLTASTKVKSDVNTEKIIADLQGLKWDDGVNYLNKLDYATKPTEVSFTPEWFPKFMKSFPKRQGRVQIKVVEVDTTEE